MKLCWIVVLVGISIILVFYIHWLQCRLDQRDLLSSLWKRKGEKIQMCRIWKQLLRKGRRDRNMNNKLEVIGIDHGWSMMKTISQVFVTGVKEITTTPALFGDVLEYEGKFYKVGTVRQEVKDTKVEDDSFYLLTLAAVAKELKRRGLAEAKVFLAVGLPLTRFGAEKNDLSST